MKLTLIEMVQNILSAMDSDDVNDVSATVESTQVATVVQESYLRLIADRDWPFLRTLTTLYATSVGTPTTMTMPPTLNKLLWIKYNKRDVQYLDPLAFKTMLDGRGVVAGVVSTEGFLMTAQPQYWTTYDDVSVVFDGYDSAVDDFLQESKVAVYAVVAPVWNTTNAFVPNLPDKFFPTLLAEAKATCFLNMKQQGNQREEKNAHVGRVRMQNEAWRADAGETKYNTAINYGRHSGGRK